MTSEPPTVEAVCECEHPGGHAPMKVKGVVVQHDTYCYLCNNEHTFKPREEPSAATSVDPVAEGPPSLDTFWEDLWRDKPETAFVYKHNALDDPDFEGDLDEVIAAAITSSREPEADAPRDPVANFVALRAVVRALVVAIDEGRDVRDAGHFALSPLEEVRQLAFDVPKSRRRR